MTIVIRSVAASDAASYQAISSQPSVQENTLGMPCPSLESWQTRLAQHGHDGVYHFAAENAGRIAGIITLRHPQHPRIRHVVNIGMFVDEQQAGQGVGSALLAFAIDYASSWLGVVKIELEVFADNHRAIGLYEKLGFEKEGIRKQSALRRGVFTDVLLMGRLTSHKQIHSQV